MANKKASKVGRPKLPERERREVTPIRLSPIEKAQFERAAKRAGLNLSDWVRETLNRSLNQ